jgi:hypothetical protein
VGEGETEEGFPDRWETNQEEFGREVPDRWQTNRWETIEGGKVWELHMC